VAEPFRHRLRVRYNECDPQNVVFNANYVVKEDGAVAEGEVRHVFINTANGDTAPIPDTVRSGLAKYVAEQTV
jgi:acyl-CoA thioesterase FadM